MHFGGIRYASEFLDFRLSGFCGIRLASVGFGTEFGTAGLIWTSASPSCHGFGAPPLPLSPLLLDLLPALVELVQGLPFISPELRHLRGRHGKLIQRELRLDARLTSVEELLRLLQPRDLIADAGLLLDPVFQKGQSLPLALKALVGPGDLFLVVARSFLTAVIRRILAAYGSAGFADVPPECPLHVQ